jgi:DNA helicase-2/ATP-dependent DNA helicase PcrA
LSAPEKSLEEAFLIDLVRRVTSDSAFFSTLSEEALAKFSERAKVDSDSDLEEDCLAWRQISKDVRRHLGKTPSLDQFLQELQLRSKEPAAKHESVVLMTIHGAKGREFDFVYLIGLAEEVLPSFHSTQKGDHSPEMEEERRNCFVAITRAKECLVLSRANTYKGWQKAPSRFLSEMGLV